MMYGFGDATTATNPVVGNTTQAGGTTPALATVSPFEWFTAPGTMLNYVTSCASNLTTCGVTGLLTALAVPIGAVLLFTMMRRGK
jgi:hypothetical protein